MVAAGPECEVALVSSASGPTERALAAPVTGSSSSSSSSGAPPAAPSQPSTAQWQGMRGASVTSLAGVHSGASGADAQGRPRRTVAEGDEEIEKLRRNTVNTKHLVSLVLADPALMKISKGMRAVSEPVQLLHGQQVVMCKTQQGAIEYLAGMATGKYLDNLGEVFNFFSDLNRLAKIGIFTCDFYAAEDTVEDDNTICEALLEYACEIVVNELLVSTFYSSRLPGRLFGLLGTDTDNVSATLDWMSSLWDSLMVLEKEKLQDKWLASYHSDLLWPLSIFCREALVALRETRFNRTPPDLLADIQGLARGFMTTKPVEDLFNTFGDEARQSKSGRLSRMARWHRAITSNVLLDCDRKQVDPDATAKYAAGSSMPSTVFQDPTREFSVGKACLSSLTSSASQSAWPHPGTQAFFCVGVATTAFVENQRDLKRLKFGWLSLLVPPRALLIRKANNETFFTLRATQFGVVSLVCATGSVRGVRRLKLLTDGKLRWALVQINKLEDWLCMPVKPSVPAEHKIPDGGVLMCIPGDVRATPLLQFAARGAFKGLVVPNMKRLASWPRTSGQSNSECRRWSWTCASSWSAIACRSAPTQRWRASSPCAVSGRGPGSTRISPRRTWRPVAMCWRRRWSRRRGTRSARRRSRRQRMHRPAQHRPAVPTASSRGGSRPSRRRCRASLGHSLRRKYFCRRCRGVP